jgi:Uma2 family endonuclease
MYAVISREKIHLPPGTVVRMEGKTWQDYQALVEQLGDRVLPRIKYRPGEILLMAPMARHGREAHVLAAVAEILLDHFGQEYEAFTPITMDLPEVRGIEPDYCFYIGANREPILGKDRIDWAIDPPPDLVIEIDVTSYTDIDDYLPYRVPEVWLFKNKRLIMYQWQQGSYVVVDSSRYFPNLNLSRIIQNYLSTTANQGRSIASKSLRQEFPPA